MIKKLKQKRGETLIEALVSLLIAVLSMSFLASSVMAASNINAENRENDKEYAEQLFNAEGLAVENEANAKVKIDFRDSNLTDAEIDIILYGGETNAFISYEEAVTSESEENSEETP